MNPRGPLKRSLEDRLVSNLGAVVLAGGKSRRMGTDKALLRLGGLTLIDRIAREARRVTDEIWISANEEAPYAFLGYPIIADRYAARGPLAGLHSGFLHSRREMLLLLACDMPEVRAPFLRLLIDAVEGFDAVLPTTGRERSHALCGVFRRSCLPDLEATLQLDHNKVTDLLERPGLRVRWLTAEEGGFRESDLRNLNSLSDLEDYRNWLGSD
jgi:molybdopterin-guanine dinucleotide biosynthesis protein A